MAEEYNHIKHLREIAKKCQVCKVPMIGTTSIDRQKYCSDECRNAVRTRRGNGATTSTAPGRPNQAH